MMGLFALHWRVQMMLAVAVLAAAVFADGGVDAAGGQITPVNLSFEQPLSQWYFFYSASNASANATISITDSRYAAGSNFRQIALPSTSGYYLISDASDPFGASLAAANLSGFDAHFNLSQTESATRLFNETSSFSSDAGVNTPALSLSLPTLYIPGANDTHAFRVGVAQAGQNFIFVVPQASAVGMDGQAYDYQFFLPYSNDSATFYVFSIVRQAAPSADTGGTPVVSPSIDYQWAYDGTRLQITTLTDVSISMIDVIGKTYNANSGSAAKAELEILPGRYNVRMSKSGYRDLSDTIYLPESALKKEEKPPEKAPEKLTKVTVERSQEGITVCVGDACYFQGAAEVDSTRLLSDLTCTGALCELVNISPSAFIARHQLKRIGQAGVSGANRPDALNIAAQIDALGRDLSARLGGRPNTAASPLELAAIAIGLLASGAAVYWGSKYLTGRKARSRGGYG
ncbi:Uncharacterised protein [uncultured archaeon]|nr:Uncharacterised protein [uncultured archaeon]